MAWRLDRPIGLVCVALVVGASCSVFPDEATLPASPGGASASAGAGAVDAAAGAAGQESSVVPLGGTAGESPVGMAGTTVVAQGGAAGQPSLGVGGEGGAAPACVNPRTTRVAVADDTWIGSARPSNNHGSDKVLSVAAGTDEHRLLVALTLPPAVTGAVLRSALLRFHLESNADVALARRDLGLHQLSQALIENHATWDNYDNGGGSKWAKPGGDFGPELARLSILAGKASGDFDFDVTNIVNKLTRAAPIPLSLIALERTDRPAPAELDFTSTEGNASQIPQLLLVYCDP